MNLLKSIDIILNDLEFCDKVGKFELNDNIIQLKNFIEKNNQKKNKREQNNSSLIRKID